jgi:hypothetical protein
VDEVQEAVNKGKEYSYKIKLPDKTEFSVPIWDTGTQEAFLIHVQQAKSACKRKGLFKDYDDALEAFDKFDEQVKSPRRTIANAKKKGADETSPTLQDDHKADLKEALLERKTAEGNLKEAAEGFFSLYANLLSEDAFSIGTRLSPARLEQPHGPTYKGMSTLRLGKRVNSPLRIVSPSTYWTCFQTTLRNNSASILAMC